MLNFELRIQKSKFIISEGNQLKTQNSKLYIVKDMTDNIDIMDELDVQDMAVDGYDADAPDDETGQL